jgi:8-oxo-dGTP pyrophosphatase MutT (NUDIX family)
MRLNSDLTPLPAATVTLVRDGANGVEVLLMQRNLHSGFVPGHRVFPGGALDEHDASPEMEALCAGISDAAASRRLGVSSGGLAYWVAAVREAFEEAGLLLACGRDGALVEFRHEALAQRFLEHRRAVDEGRRPFADVLREEGLRLAASRLVYFSHWITPVGRSRRYDTRSFVAAAPAAQEALCDQRETIDHVWISPGAALDRHRCGEFEMRLPTVRTLELFADFNECGSLIKAMAARREIPPILPRLLAGERYLMPGEPGYEEAGDREEKRQTKERGDVTSGSAASNARTGRRRS